MLRFVLLLLLVIGSAHCYRFDLYNSLTSPITIQTTRNGVQSSVTIPAAVNGVPSVWPMGEYGKGETSRFEYLNLHTATHPSVEAGNIDIEAGYANQPVNTDVAMIVWMDEYRIMCNWMENPLCFNPQINSYDYTQVFTMKYLLGFTITINFTNRTH